MAIEPQDPTTPESGPETSIEKFKTPEDRDKAYLELEKFSRDQARRLADLEKKLEVVETMQAPQDQRSFTDLYPAAQPTPEQRETELASRLLTQPSRVLQEFGERVRGQTLQEVQQHLAAERAVMRFEAENPDLVPHKDLVSLYVQKQPDTLSPAERLKRAAPEARKYLASIAKGNVAQTSRLDPDSYVESPTQRSQGNTSRVVEESEEDALTEMINERNAIQAKKRI